jgi:hypothetical protein
LDATKPAAAWYKQNERATGTRGQDGAPAAKRGRTVLTLGWRLLRHAGWGSPDIEAAVALRGPGDASEAERFTRRNRALSSGEMVGAGALTPRRPRPRNRPPGSLLRPDPGGPTTGGEVVPCNWRNPPQGGPIPLAELRSGGPMSLAGDIQHFHPFIEKWSADGIVVGLQFRRSPDCGFSSG